MSMIIHYYFHKLSVSLYLQSIFVSRCDCHDHRLTPIIWPPFVSRLLFSNHPPFYLYDTM